MILSTLVTSQLHFEMCAGLYGYPVYILKNIISVRGTHVTPAKMTIFFQCNRGLL